MDVLAPTTMKNAVKCDTSCESQNPVSHQNFERSLHFFGSMSVGVSVPSTPFRGGDDRFQWKRVKMQCVSVCSSAAVFLDLCRKTRRQSIDCLLHKSEQDKTAFWQYESFGPPLSQDYPLNLSILLGGGKETNKDSLSNGE